MYNLADAHDLSDWPGGGAAEDEVEGLQGGAGGGAALPPGAAKSGWGRGTVRSDLDPRCGDRAAVRVRGGREGLRLVVLRLPAGKLKKGES